jgi:hypothetical protein
MRPFMVELFRPHRKLIKREITIVLLLVLTIVFLPMLHYTYLNPVHPHMVLNTSQYLYTFEQYLSDYKPEVQREKKIIIGKKIIRC